jgi:hypothetical protein
MQTLQPCKGALRLPAETRALGGGIAIAMCRSMSDLLALLVTAGFFGIAWAYVHACDRL